ncbi:hypothetical protein ABTP05_19130, partial [Acinetobacter baumannii]
MIGAGASALGLRCFTLLYAARAPVSAGIVTRGGRPADLVAPLAPPAEIAAVEAAAHGVVPVPTATP